MRLYFDSDLRAETRGDDGPPKITGYGLRFGVKSEDLGGFREVIAPDVEIKRRDVTLLWNHDASKPIAREGNGSLRFAERDNKGLPFEADPDDTSWSVDAVKSIRAGTVYRTSFGFRKVRDEWAEDGRLRILRSIEIFDVSPVTFPAYKQTRISVRAERIADLTERLEAGEELRDAELRFLREALDELRQALTGKPTETRGEPGDDGGRDEQDSLVLLAEARLRLAEHEVTL